MGKADVVVGTHALFQEAVEFKNLGFVVIDEQHKFGVIQRAKLREKGENPDVLVMTATPIQRTLSLTIYGDLDVSVIDELPPGRQEIKTVQRPDMARAKLMEFMRAEIDQGDRVGVSSTEAERIKDLEREVRELRRANEILKAASAFFARELDPQPRR